MNLTKKQLVEIIERKDVVEKQHVAEVKSLKARVENSTLTEEGLNVKIQDLEKRLKSATKDMDGTLESLKVTKKDLDKSLEERVELINELKAQSDTIDQLSEELNKALLNKNALEFELAKEKKNHTTTKWLAFAEFLFIGLMCLMFCL